MDWRPTWVNFHILCMSTNEIIFHLCPPQKQVSDHLDRLYHCCDDDDDDFRECPGTFTV